MKPEECVGSKICPVTGQSVAACDLSRKTVLVLQALSGFSDGLKD